ncbi:Tn3 family transposase [Microtetraspora malaysiensis]|uniref:Tn3 family transposase n=1 Tax=Microtetraspora malaysiensis TaxID=161358 RepID=UPI003D8FE57F
MPGRDPVREGGAGDRLEAVTRPSASHPFVPVPSVYARPNPKYFGRRGGATWLNMINDQAAGLGGRLLPAPRAPRNSLYVLDVLYRA